MAAHEQNLKVICTGGYPCVNVINKCISSVIDQEYKNWQMAVVLDPADYKIYLDDERVLFHFNEEEKLGTVNTLKAVSMLNPDDDDILVFLDGDDWLYHNNVFDRVVKEYEGNVLVTHGSWKTFNAKYDKAGNNYAYVEGEDIRKSRFHASALRTVKYKVFKLIKDEDFKIDGHYFKSGCDVAIMIPCLEMVGLDRVKFIDEILYFYNIDGVRTPQTHRKEAAREYEHVKQLTPYSRI